MSGKHVLGWLCLTLILAAGCDNRREVTRVDSEKEANRILVELEARGVGKAEKASVTEQRKTAFSITVPQDALSQARTILVQCDLPRESHSGLSTVAESSSLIPTKTEERAKLMYAMAGELERTLETYDRVVSARVHIVLPEKDLLQRDSAPKPTASAMVLIKYTPAMAEQPETGGTSAVRPSATRPGARGEYADAPVAAEEVQQMVAKSVEGLTPQNVFVAYTKSAARPPTPPVVAVAADSAASDQPAKSSGSDPRLIQLFIATAVFGLIAIVLTALLVREKRKQRTALALTRT